jgi:hypothetical protein
MSDVWRLRLVSLVALLLLFIMPGLAVAGWRVLPATGFVADPLHTRLIHTLGGLWIRTDQSGDRFLVHQGVPIALGDDVIDAMAVCYRADPGTWITAIGLVEFLGVGDSTGKIRHIDRTDLNSPTDTCYFSPVAEFMPAGAVNLWLETHFSSSNSGTIFVGAVGVHVK